MSASCRVKSCFSSAVSSRCASAATRSTSAMVKVVDTRGWYCRKVEEVEKWNKCHPSVLSANLITYRLLRLPLFPLLHFFHLLAFPHGPEARGRRRQLVLG